MTHKPKGFGYCTYALTVDVLRALRLLNGFAVDSRQILLKVDSKTQEQLNAFEKVMPERMRQEEAEKDEEVKQVLRALYEDRSGIRGGQQNDVASWGGLLGDNRETAEGGTSADGNTKDPSASNADPSREANTSSNSESAPGEQGDEGSAPRGVSFDP